MTHTIKVTLSSPVAEWAKEQTKDAIIGGLEAIREILIEASYSIALVGGGVCILFWLSGWKSGNRWAGILFMAHVLIKFLLGGI